MNINVINALPNYSLERKTGFTQSNNTHFEKQSYSEISASFYKAQFLTGLINITFKGADWQTDFESHLQNGWDSYKKGEYNDALNSAIDASLVLSKHRLPKSHLDHAKIKNLLGSVLLEGNLLNQAEECLNEAKGIFDVSTDTSDSDRIRNLIGLGHVQRKKQEFKTSKNTFNLAFNMLGKDLQKPESLECLNGIAAAHVWLASTNNAPSHLEKAEGYLNKALRACEQLFEYDPLKADTYLNMGLLKSAQGRYAESSDYLDKALKIRTNIFGEDSTKVAEVLARHGENYKRSGGYGRAEGSFVQALEIYLKKSDRDKYGINLNNAGYMYYMLGNMYLEREEGISFKQQSYDAFEQAKTNFAEAAKIFEKQHEENLLALKNTYSSLNRVCGHLRDHGEATRYMRMAQKVEEELSAKKKLLKEISQNSVA